MARQCEICCTDTPRHAAACARCEFVSCRECAKRWIGERGAGTCARCDQPWDSREMYRRLGPTFFKGAYRAHRAAALAREARPRLHEMRPRAAHETARRRLVAHLHATAHRVRAGERSLVAEMHEAARALRQHVRGHPAASLPSDVPCVACEAEGATGVLRNGQCTACRARLCVACGAAVAPHASATHVCDADAVRSRKLIDATCRPCVRCAAPSARAEGCVVMWCVHCHAFWNWETGQLIDTRRHVPHNPDHRRWVAATSSTAAREIDDIPCGGMVDVDEVHAGIVRDLMADLVVANTHVLTLSTDALMRAQRMRHAYPVQAPDDAVAAACMAHLVGDVPTEPGLARSLERIERLHLFRCDVADALGSFVLAGTDLLQRFLGAASDALTTADELEALRELVDAELVVIERVHSRKVPRLSALWAWDVPYQRRA